MGRGSNNPVVSVRHLLLRNSISGLLGLDPWQWNMRYGINLNYEIRRVTAGEYLFFQALEQHIPCQWLIFCFRDRDNPGLGNAKTSIYHTRCDVIERGSRLS